MMGMLSIGGSGGGGEGGCGGGGGGRGGGGGGRFPALLLQLMLMMMPAVCLFNAQPLSSSATVDSTEDILQPAAHNPPISPRTQHLPLNGGSRAGAETGPHGVFTKKTAALGSTTTSPTEPHQVTHSPAEPANSPMPPFSSVTRKNDPPPPAVNALPSSNKSEPANTPVPPSSLVTTKRGPPSPPVNAMSSNNTSEASHSPGSPETTSEQMMEPAEAADNNRPLTTVTAMLLLVAIVLFVGLLHFKVGTALRRRCKSMGCAESLSVGMLKANAVRGLKLACQRMSRAAPDACSKKDEVVIVQSSTGQVFTPVIRMVDQSSGRSAVIYVDQSHV